MLQINIFIYMACYMHYLACYMRNIKEMKKTGNIFSLSLFINILVNLKMNSVNHYCSDDSLHELFL
ncbi:MAG: hypothetical protein ACJAYB_001446 [Psychromonas sp.]|jgi:hypothetical protein